MGVNGIGGFIFRAADPDTLRAWYAGHLGVGTGDHGEWRPGGPERLHAFPGPDSMLEALAASRAPA